jgi:hypothetical protein
MRADRCDDCVWFVVWTDPAWRFLEPPGRSVPLGQDMIAAGVAVAAYSVFFSTPLAMLPWPVAVGMLAHALRWVALDILGLGVATGALVACVVVGLILTPVSRRTSRHSVFAARRCLGLQRRHSALRQPTRIDGRHRDHDRGLCNGLSVRSAAPSIAENGFDGGDDRQSHQYGPVADGIAVVAAALDDGRSRTPEAIPVSARRFPGGLPCGHGCHINAWRLGVVHPGRARGYRDSRAIKEPSYCRCRRLRIARYPK